MKMKVEIETQTFVRFWLVVLGFIVLLGSIYLAKGALITIGIALFFALALNPPVTALAAKLPGKSRVGATALAYLIVVTLIGGVLFLVVPPIIQQTAKFTESFPTLIDKATSQKPLLDDLLQRYNLTETFNQAIEEAKNAATDASAQLGALLVRVVTGTFGWLVNLVFVLVLGFFMLIEGPNWMRKIWGLYEDKDMRDLHKSSVEKMYRVVTGFVNGQIAVASIGAVFVCITLLVMSAFQSFNLPPNLALPLAVIVFVMELIPMIGATLATIVVGLVLLFNSPIVALVFVLIYIIYQQFENNLIAPHIQSKNVELSVLWILIALLIGTSLFGLVGGLISIPVAGCLRVLLVDYLDYSKKRRHHTVPKSPVKLVAAKKDKKT